MPRPIPGQIYIPAKHEIETHSGVYFNLLDPKPDDVNVLDVATALSRICRYTGHPSRFYSVAEHLVRASYVPLDGVYRGKTAHRIRLAILLHDAHEAYCGDVSSPLKRAMEAIIDRFPEWKGYLNPFALIENACERAVAAHFGQWHGFTNNLERRARGEVKRADMIMLKTEAQVILPSKGQGWGLDHIQTHRHRSMATEYGWPWRKARFEFLQRFNQLRGWIDE
jgi:hypothetical protein